MNVREAGDGERTKQGDDCPQCGHPFNPHAVISTSNSPLDGGIILCAVKGCPCYATWGVESGPAKVIPDRFELEAIRERIQSHDQ